MYAARPDLRGNVDAIGWHAYAPTVSGVIDGVRSLRHTLEQLGDPGVPIHITELGWPTHGTDKRAAPIVVSEDARAQSLETAAEALARSDCDVRAVIPYTWTTPEKNIDDEEDWYGIRHPDGSPTPTSDALTRVLERWRTDPQAGHSARFKLCHLPGRPGVG
jgi:exo-beta-1,3-glucanase (GH17 family)